MFSENIIIIIIIIIKMPAFRVDKFSAGRTKCRPSKLKRTWWNSLALFNLQGVLKPFLGLDLIDPESSKRESRPAGLKIWHFARFQTYHC